MSRSFRKTPIIGIAGRSEKADKKAWHSRMRGRERQRLKDVGVEDEDYLTTDRREVSDVWGMNKDGKMMLDDRSVEFVAEFGGVCFERAWWRLYGK